MKMQDAEDICTTLGAALTMPSVPVCYDTKPGLIICEAENGIQGAADLERAGALQRLQLKQQQRQRRKSADAVACHHGRGVYMPADAL